jgi:hypothetical protein
LSALKRPFASAKERCGRRAGWHWPCSLPQPSLPVVAVPGAGLMPAAPLRPVQEMAGRVSRPAEGRVQSPDLVHRQAEHLPAARIVVIARPGAGRLSTGCLPLSGPAAITGPAAGARFRRGPAAGSADGQPGGGAHGQRDVAIPGDMLTGLIVVQAGLVLGCLEAFLDRPPGPGHPGEAGEADRPWRPAQVIGQLAAGQRPADQQVLAIIGVGERPVIQPLALRPRPARVPLPATGRHLRGELIRADHALRLPGL